MGDFSNRVFNYRYCAPAVQLLLSEENFRGFLHDCSLQHSEKISPNALREP